VKVTILIYLFSLTLAQSKCHLKPEYKYISLSGPITHHLYQYLEIVNDPSIKAISAYHKIPQGQFAGKYLGGGLFLSSKYLSAEGETVVFFDKSRDLKRNLKKSKIKKSIEVETRGLTPFEVMVMAQEKLDPFLVNCERKKNNLAPMIKKWEEKLERSFQQGLNLPVVFFLGKLDKGQRLPNQLMVNDGFVKWLNDKELIRSYPSPLAYVSWSGKILKTLLPRVSIGLDTSASEKANMNFAGKKNHWNLQSGVGLIPGWPQASLLEILAKNWNNLR